MFLSKDSLATEIITAKSSEMNVMIPDGDEFVSLIVFISGHDDMFGNLLQVEQPVPEQFKTVVKGIKLSTVTTESL